ncbi:MAG: AmmeMemoRadiSam system protein B [Bacteroidales bacterium]|nr:AmmeMemoRadiSam system protein B [Bacteroidales bacterium]
MKHFPLSFAVMLIGFLVMMGGCGEEHKEALNIRPLADTVGFARYDWQMDEIMTRIKRLQGNGLEKTRERIGIKETDYWKTAISPHDDYAYAGHVYVSVLRNIKAPLVVLFGVAHKAKAMNVEDRIVFDSYDAWKGPYGPVKVSYYRQELIRMLPHEMFEVNDSLHRMEHSLEALVPYLQYYNREVQVIPILVPYMSLNRMEEIAVELSEAIYKLSVRNNLHWGRDFAMVISNDAVHYGDEDWGGKDFAFFGTDSAGYNQALRHEKEIIGSITGVLDTTGIRSFCDYTVQKEDHREYKWTWCGRYSVPFGLLTSFYLNGYKGTGTLRGIPVTYANSIDHPVIPVDDLRMGVTAPAHVRHWVGYAAIGYK